MQKLFTAHRPEIDAYIEACRGHAMSVEDFIIGYRALGLPRTSPAKGRVLYKWLTRTGVIAKKI